MRTGRVGRTASAALGAALAAALGLAACSAPGNGTATIVGTLPAATSRDDPFAPHQEFTSAALRGGTAASAHTLRLVGRRDRKTGDVTMHVRVEVVYRDYVKHYYDTARNVRAEVLALHVVARDFPLCTNPPCFYGEQVRVDVPLAEITAAAGAGYQLKLFSRIGREKLITVPKELIATVLASMGIAPGAPAANPAPAAPAPAAPATARRS